MKKCLSLVFLVFFMVLFVACGNDDGGSSGNNKESNSSATLSYANIPAGTKGIFRASVTNSAMSSDDERSVMSGEDSLKDGVLYAALEDGSLEEITFNDEIVLTFSEFRDVGRGYGVGKYQRQWGYRLGQGDVLLDGKTGKMYILKVDGGDIHLNTVEVIGHYAYFRTSDIAYRLDLTDMEYIAFNNPQFDPLYDALFIKTGSTASLLNRGTLNNQVFPGGAALPYELGFASGENYVNVIKPTSHLMTSILTSSLNTGRCRQ